MPRAGRLVRGAGLARAFGAVAFLGVWAALAAFWEIAVARGWLNGRVLPPPSVLGAYVLAGNMSAGIGYGKVSYGQAILDTLGRVMAGFVIGLLGALVTAMLIWAFRPVRAVAMPLMQTIAPIAPVAWIPLAISLVGLGSGAAILVVVLAILGGVCASAVAAFDAIPGEYVKAGRLLGARGLRLWLRVVLPAAAPALVTLARMSFFGAWMAVLAGEMAGISSGLGALIMLGQQQFNMRLVMIGIVTIGALGFLIDRALLRLGRSLVWWEHRSARQVAR
ncbi:ABC transporter permease [uncultured Methylobacterium sp.]|uniref:ABC transporter permease n=1 Tax=uncultured Methylobacterium sp. TaxID=157278 RepID=UPI0035CB4347